MPSEISKFGASGRPAVTGSAPSYRVRTPVTARFTESSGDGQRGSFTPSRRAPVLAPIFSMDDLAPRDERNRFRIYRRRRGELELIATTGSPKGVGLTLCTLAAEGEFPRGTAVGVLDSQKQGRSRGRWIVNPFEAGA